MKKKDIENLASALPSFFKNSAGYLNPILMRMDKKFWAIQVVRQVFL